MSPGFSESMRKLHEPRGARLVADVAHALLRAVSTPALLFDTVCESCARTGRREESSLSLTVPSLNLVLRSELASVWLNGARRQYLFRVECAFGRVFVFEEQEDVFPAG